MKLRITYSLIIVRAARTVNELNYRAVNIPSVYKHTLSPRKNMGRNT